MRRLLQIKSVLILIVCIVLAACTQEEPPATVIVTEIVEGETVVKVITATPEPEVEEVEDENVLYASLDLEVASLDPLYGNAAGGNDLKVYYLFYEPLIRMTKDGSFEPALADAWEISEDGMEITFSLRQGIKFHDGTDFNADAVIFNLNRAIDPDLDSVHASELPNVEMVEKIDDYTVVVHLSSPSIVDLTDLTIEAGLMVSPTAVETMGEDFHRNPVGTGPFQFVEWIGDDRIVGERFGEYWRSDDEGNQLPYADKVVVRKIPDPSVKLLELLAGNLHIADSIEAVDFHVVERDPNLQLFESGQGVHQWMTFNVTQPPFDNEDLRKAILYGIDRETMAQVVVLGYGQVTPTLVPPLSWIYDPDLSAYTYDTEMARTLLSDAGYPNGIEVTLKVIQRDPDIQIAQLLQSQLSEIGVDVEILILERQAWVEQCKAKDYEMALLRIGVPRTDPHATFGKQFGRSSVNWAGQQDEELFSIVDEASQAVDMELRKDLYRQAQEILLNKGYYGFLFFRPLYYPASIQVLDLPMNMVGAWYLGEVKLSE